MAGISYSKVGDNYSTKDPIKILAQKYALGTSKNLRKSGFQELTGTRGESAYVWKQGNIYMASVIEGLGTKNIIADEMRKVTGKTYYDSIAYDTVATIVNDLVSVGAKPLTLHAYWAIENNSWLSDEKRMKDLLIGWAKACDYAGVSWGGGETPTLQGVMTKNAIELGGSAVGIIQSKDRLILDTKIKAGDKIIFVKSNGINANGASLIRSLLKKLPQGYKTKLPNGKYVGEAVLSRSNIYSKLVQKLLDSGINIHYLSNITGHGLRKIMRAKQDFTYIIEDIFKPSIMFEYIQKKSGMNDYDAYGTFNMGQDYAIFVDKKDVKGTLTITKGCGFKGIEAGYVEKGPKRVIVEPKSITFEGSALGVR